jgi:hypothetical protein
MICGKSKWRCCSTFGFSPFTVPTNHDDIIGNRSTISETSETESITTPPFRVTTNRDDIMYCQLSHHDLWLH